MDDKLKQLYELYSKNGLIKTTDFNTFSSANESQRKQLYDLGRKNGLFNTTNYNTFSTAFSPVKKKGSTGLPSQPQGKSTTSATVKTTTQKPSVSSGGKKTDYEIQMFTGFPGKEGKQYALDKSSAVPVWREKSNAGYDKAITDPARVDALNKHFKQKASSSEMEQVFTGFPGKEFNEYRVRDGKWERRNKGATSWQTVINEGSILGLNKQFKQNVEVTKDIEKAKIDQKREIDNKKNLNKLLSSVNSNLVGSSEEYASEELEKKFPGFKFIQQGLFSDNLLVIAPNDNRVNISLDNFTDSDDRSQATVLREFIRNNSDEEMAAAERELSFAEREKERFLERSEKEMFENDIPSEFKFVNGKLVISTYVDKQTKTKQYAAIEDKLKENRKKYIDKKEEQFDDIYYRFKNQPYEPNKMEAAYASVRKDDAEIKRVNDYINDVRNTSKDIASEKAKIEDQMNDLVVKLRSGEITRDQYNAEYKPAIEEKLLDLKNRGNQLANEISNINVVNKAVDESIAKNFIIDESKGSFGGGMASKFVKGLTYIPRIAAAGSMSKKEQNDLVDLITGKGTTQEYTESSDRSDLVKSLFSLSESMGALTAGAALGGGAATYASFYAQSYYEMKDELDEIKGMTDAEKVLMSSVYGSLSSVLEKFGVDMITQKTPIGRNLKNNILKRMFSDLPKDASKEFIDAAMLNSVKMTLANAGLNAVGGAVGEGVTESLQSLSSVGIKEVYDRFNGNKYFNNKSGWEILSDVMYEGYLGALGGGVMSTVASSASVVKNGLLNAVNKEQAELLVNAAKTEGVDQALITNLKASILKGNITKEEAKVIADSFNEIKGKIQSMPDNLSISDKSVALDLMVEKDKIEKEIAGKDENLVAAQKARIADINNQLKTISEDAVQKQTAGEVPVQPEAEISGEMAEGKPQAEPQVTAEESKKEVDSYIANRFRNLKIEPVVGPLLEKMNNAEYIDDADVDNALEVIFAELDDIDNSEYSDDVKKNVKDSLLNLAENLDNYEFRTKDKTVTVAQKRAADSTRENVRKVKVEEFFSGAKATYNGEEVEFDTTDGTVKAKRPNGETIVFDTPSMTVKEDGIVIGEDGNVSTVTMVDRFGSEFTFDGDIALDLAIKDRQNKIGEIPAPVFEVVMEEMTVKEPYIKESKVEAAPAQAVETQVAPVAESTEQQAAPVVETTQKKTATTKEDVLKLDTKEENNLQKVLNALDKIEKDLDQFGKETLGVNIPIALAKTIVKAVKTLVKTGITLEQAIKQIAAEYNLSDRDVKSLVTPTKVSDINVNEVRSKDRPGKRISKGISVKTVGGNKVIEETEDLSLEYVKKNAPKVFISNANIISKYPLIAGKKKFETATTIEEAQEIYDVFVREVANNLNYLMDEFKPEFREISTLWYDGANAIANDFADQFGVSAEQAAGIIAAMSPQKDWYQNVRLAEMVLMAYKDNPVMTKEMIDYQKGVNEKGLYEGAVSPGKKLNNAEKEYKRSKTKANKEALDEAKDKLNKAIEKANSVISMLEQYIGKKLNDVPAFVQPYMVRTYHEVNTTKDYNIVAPDGSVQGVARKNDGTKAKVAWGSYSEIGKAVAIYNDGSQENITKSLGEMHKIRNFYNNIIDPMSKDGDVTMDTHAIAAALLLPLSGNSVQVGQNFGTGTSNSAPFGIKGLYYAYADAYALSAKENNLLPRQVQSITWEAIRGLYTDTFKSNKTQVANINNIWKEYQDGKITIDEARKQAKDAAGGIKDPTWARPIQDELGEISKEESISGRGKGDGRNIVGGSEGGDVLTADTKDKKILKKALDFLDKADNDLNKFGKETLGINIPVATMRAIIKLAKTLVKTGITLQDAIIQAAEQKNVSKKDALNAIKFMSETINRPVKKVIVNEMAALRDQLKFEARAARESQQDLKRRQRELIVAVNNMKRSGTVTAAQAAVLAKKITYLNVYNPVMVDRFLQYAERVFKNAEYQTILYEASKVRKSIKNFMKNNQANVTAMAKDFGKINPSMVEDIEQYLKNAKAVLNAVKRSKQDTDFPIKNAADIDVITKYTEDMLEKQEEQLKNEKLKEYQDLVDKGMISGDMTLKEIIKIIKSLDEEGINNKTEKEAELRKFLNTKFKMYSDSIKEILKTKVDPFTGDTVEISDKDKEVLKRLLKVNLDDMSVKNAYTIVESMDNFIVNGITDGLDGAISAYEGDIEAKKLVSEGMKARKIKGLLFGLSPVTGRAIYDNFATLPVLFDSLFSGVKSGIKVMNAMGFNLLSRGFAKATKIYDNAINDYGNKFSKSKPNGQQFNTSFNAYERGMLAYLKRTVPGNETAQKAEFKRRVELIRESIQSLREYGNEDQQKMANIYEEVYNKLGLDNADITIDQVQSNVDPKNAEAVNWWIDQWSQHYSDLYDVSLDVYNTKLGKDINYTTDRYSRVDGERELVDEATGNIGAFALDLGLTSYKDKAGVLMESNKNFKSLDTGKKSSTRFVNLDFDVSNASALRSALIDVNTASAVRRVDAFLNSRSYDKLFAEEKDAKFFKKRLQNYILKYKNKVAFSDPSLGELNKYMDLSASIGSTRALGGPSQAVLQTVPVFLSTLFNAGVRNTDFKGLVSDTSFHKWLNNSGYAIANRGMETSTAIESANKYLDKVAETKGEKFFKGVMKLNEFWLKTFLSQPDVWIARNSWKSYYVQSLREQKLYNGSIDWDTHELNEKAADYAQHMVDRQQNVSDAAMMGDFMNSEQPVKKIVRKVVLPFANFIMNQKTRLYSDIRTLSSGTSTREDKIKAGLSIGGLMTEIVAYNAISYALKLYVYDTIAAALTGYEEDEEEKEKNKRNRIKFVTQNVVKDIFSPLPLADGVTIQGFNFIADFFQEKTMSQDEINKAVEERNIYLESRGKEKMTAKEKEKFVKEFVDSQKMVFEEYETKKWIDLGTATIAIEKARELYKMIDMSVTGKFKKEFKGNEVEKVILPDNMGDMKTATTLSALYNLGLLPREFNSVATSMKKYIEKNAISEEQLEDYKMIKKEFGDVDGYKKDLLKSKMKIDNVIDEIKWVEKNGGLTKEQSEEYKKLREVKGEVYIDDLKKLQKGIKAEKIYKKG